MKKFIGIFIVLSINYTLGFILGRYFEKKEKK